MSERVCPQCGAPVDPNAQECKFCGEKLMQQQAQQQVQQPINPQPQTIYVQQPQPTVVVQQQPVYVTGINSTWPVKNKMVAGVLGILLGGIGVHKFYMGKIGSGILYLCFCWTGIPAMVGFIEGIMYLCSNDENFQLKHHVRLQ